MTVGLPRSGKSTWAKKYAKETGAVIVNPDSIRLALHGKDFYGPAEPEVWKIVRIMVLSLFLSEHETVILDATNLTVERRKEWLDAYKEKVRIVFVRFDTSPEVCQERAVADGRSYLLPVIDSMHARRDDLTTEELIGATLIYGELSIESTLEVLNTLVDAIVNMEPVWNVAPV